MCSVSRSRVSVCAGTDFSQLEKNTESTHRGWNIMVRQFRFDSLMRGGSAIFRPVGGSNASPNIIVITHNRLQVYYIGRKKRRLGPREGFCIANNALAYISASNAEVNVRTELFLSRAVLVDNIQARPNTLEQNAACAHSTWS